jgi:hypothetical protein
MLLAIKKINDSIAVWLTRGFGTMWICYAFMIYGILPVFRIFQPQEAAFLYWSNWIQLWSMPLILVGTNLLGRDAEVRAKLDHEKLAKSYEEQKQTYSQVIAMLKQQEEIIKGMLVQDKMLKAQDVVLAEQTQILKDKITPKKRAAKKV